MPGSSIHSHCGFPPRPRLSFKQRKISVGAQGIIIWSRLSKTANRDGKLLYQSGIRIDEPAEALVTAIAALLRLSLIKSDPESLDRKRQRLEEKERARSAQPIVKHLHPKSPIDPDQILLIQQARDKMKANPEEALKWYNRAKYAITAATGVAAPEIIYRDDVLAIWEYLERTIDLTTIIRVFENNV